MSIAAAPAKMLCAFSRPIWLIILGRYGAAGSPPELHRSFAALGSTVCFDVLQFRFCTRCPFASHPEIFEVAPLWDGLTPGTPEHGTIQNVEKSHCSAGTDQGPRYLDPQSGDQNPVTAASCPAFSAGGGQRKSLAKKVLCWLCP